MHFHTDPLVRVFACFAVDSFHKTTHFRICYHIRMARKRGNLRLISITKADFYLREKRFVIITK